MRVGCGIHYVTLCIMGHPLSAIRRPTVSIPGQSDGHAGITKSQESLRNQDNQSFYT